jgi:peptidoglycan/LPS O-acetylase OafA/YrhL
VQCPPHGRQFLQHLCNLDSDLPGRPQNSLSLCGKLAVFSMLRIETPQPLLRSRMPELDSLRGVAVLMVIFFHGFYFATGAARFHGLIRWFVVATGAGWVGVNLFFVLSGFLITGILLGSSDKPGYYRGFYLRRALRILPAYYGLLLLLLVIARSGLVERQASWGFLALSFVYLSNVTNLFGVPMQYAALWSLAVEEHFYLLWPAVVRNLSRRFLPWVCGFIILGCPALRAFCYWRHYQYGAAYTWLVADGLAWGALIALLARGRLSSRRAMFRFGVACLVGTACVVAVLLPFDFIHSGSLAGGVLLTSLINSFFAGVLILALVVGSGSWKTIFARPGLKFFGEISYGLYLVQMLAFDVVSRAMGHWGLNVSKTSGSFGLVLARFAAGASLAVGVAYLSRWYFEEPFLRLKDKFEVGRTKLPVTVLQDHALETKAAS